MIEQGLGPGDERNSLLNLRIPSGANLQAFQLAELRGKEFALGSSP